MRYDNERKIWIYNHRNCKVDNARWQPGEPGRRRNDFKTNSIVGALEAENTEGKWSKLLPIWKNSAHKEGREFTESKEENEAKENYQQIKDEVVENLCEEGKKDDI